MSDPTPPVRDVVNDPDYVPLLANANGDVLAMEDGTVLIASSTLRLRGTHFIVRRRWLQTPPPQGRKE